MENKVIDFETYVAQIPAERKAALEELRESIVKGLPEGFEEQLSYGMPGFVVPHSIFPSGYHCDPKLPLPFVSFASQKNFIALYHMGLYADEALLNWFVAEYPKHSKQKLDMGKSCIRFKKMDQIPFQLIQELMGKMSVSDWITLYQSALEKKIIK